jgi:RND family efflux transporter MFP subunit
MTVLGLCLLTSLNSFGQTSYEPRQATDKEWMRVASKTVQNWFQLEATLEAVNESTLSAQTHGRIVAIHFDVNDFVEKGTLLIQLRDKTQKATLKRAHAQLNQYQAEDNARQLELIRSLALFKKGSLSKGKLDTVKAKAASSAAAVKAASALQEQAQEQFNYTQIHAPYSGIVKTLHVQVGESVSVGSSLMTGLSLDQLRAVAHIPQRLASQISQQDDFQILHNEQVIAAQKVTVFPYADVESHSFKVRVNINRQGLNLFPGMWVKLNIPVGSKKIITIPKSAIIKNGELSGVYIKSDSGPLLRQVRLGQTVAGQVEVLAGLRVREHIFLDAYQVLATQELKK